MLNIIQKRKYSYWFSGILIVLSAAALFTWGLRLGIDFRGGTLVEVRQLFKIKGIVVAGSHVIEGTVKRTGSARLVRDSVVVWTGKLSALKRFKDDVKEVAQGFDCGISLENFNDLKEKDVVESFEIEELKQKL